ncbi:TIR domain-containing protein [Sphingomonas koreensis]|nr:TIR domain-containing protein [Sphingomonas koreensis]
MCAGYILVAIDHHSHLGEPTFARCEMRPLRYPERMRDEPSIFLSYASPDRDRVMPYFIQLKQRGFNPWIDQQKLLGGQNWDYEIRKALADAAIIVMFISNNSINRRGYVQREIKLALTKLEEKLIGDIYIIPVLLDNDAQRPDQLSDIQFLDGSDADFIDNLVAAINWQLVEAESATAAWSSESGITWSKSLITEHWNGVPGFSFSGEVLHLTSDKFENLGDFADVVKGWFKSELLRHRRMPFAQMPDVFNLGQHRAIRTTTWDATCADPLVKGRVISVRYDVGWYGAGAAHPNHHFVTFRYYLDPFCEIGTLREIFEDPDSALPVLQDHLRPKLAKRRFQDGDTENFLPEQDISNGTTDWNDLRNFVFEADGIQFFFGPYDVGPYVFGSQTALVPYSATAKFISPVLRSALDVYHFDQPQG